MTRSDEKGPMSAKVIFLFLQIVKVQIVNLQIMKVIPYFTENEPHPLVYKPHPPRMSTLGLYKELGYTTKVELVMLLAMLVIFC